MIGYFIYSYLFYSNFYLRYFALYIGRVQNYELCVTVNYSNDIFTDTTSKYELHRMYWHWQIVCSHLYEGK